MPRRRLSEEDEALWARVTATASRLATDTATTPMPPPASVPERRSLPAATAVIAPTSQQPAALPRTSWDLATDPGLAPDRPHPHMDRRRYEKLRRGRIEPEARLDLHGMTLNAAHGALIAFVLDAHARGLRTVLVITGKGRRGGADSHAPERHGVLRHAVPHWLGAPPLVARVLQVAPAHVRHGGEGACYVHLRRLR